MCVCVRVSQACCLDVAIEVSLALYLLEFPDVRYWNIDPGECLAFTLLWFHLYAHTADARFTQQYKLQMWQYMRDRDQIKLSINVGEKKKEKKSQRFAFLGDFTHKVLHICREIVLTKINSVKSVNINKLYPSVRVSSSCFMGDTFQIRIVILHYPSVTGHCFPALRLC